MSRIRRTFSSRIARGSALTASLTVLMGLAGAATLTTTTRDQDAVIAAATRQLSDSQQLNTAAEQRIGNYRAYLITGATRNLEAVTADRIQFLSTLTDLRGQLHDPITSALLDRVTQAETAYTAALDPSVQQRRTISGPDKLSQLDLAEVTPARQALEEAIAALITRVRADLDKDAQASSRKATQAIVLICLLGGAAVSMCALLALRLSRGLRREVGSAVGHMRTSSAQLEAAAATQAGGGRHQAAAMNAITTTISELLVSARQIAHNAQRVSTIAADGTQAARAGDTTINQTRLSVTAIRAQMDEIEQRMLILDARSEQISGVADLVSELAEQTNILATNATIEASAAGETGRRFAVVAEEIRGLADRTAGSARLIRTLIDDLRAAVDTTVVATQTGAKAVDAGVRQFAAATTAFRRIATLVSTADQSSREIEMSTRQQSTAVEQVNAAAADTARVTREAQTRAVQTGQTAAHLSTMSTDLQHLVGADTR